MDIVLEEGASAVGEKEKGQLTSDVGCSGRTAPGHECGKSPGEACNSAFDAFSLFKSYLDSQLKDFRQDLQHAAVIQKEAKSLKFKKESNRIQYEFNSEILRELEVVVVSKEISNKIAEIVEGLISKLKYRNKLVQVADSSPGGWVTVNEYEKPKLGSDSDDEKRLKQAEARAVKKIKSTSSSSVGSASSRFTPYKSPDFFRRYPDKPNYVEQFQSSRGGFNSFRGGKFSSTRQGVCFSCGFKGHFRAECPMGSRAHGYPGSTEGKLPTATVTGPTNNK